LTSNPTIFSFDTNTEEENIDFCPSCHTPFISHKNADLKKCALDALEGKK